MFRILIATATLLEINILHEYLKKNWISQQPFVFQKGNVEVNVLVTGVGLPMMAYSLGKFFSIKPVHFAINAGIGGAIDRQLSLGDVVQVISERFADLGAEQKDGSFEDLHEMGLIAADAPPFEKGRMWNEQAGTFAFLPTAHGLSVNKVHGHELSIARMVQKYPDAGVESMEGAAFFYAALIEKTPFLEIRAISNYVEPRNRESWDIPLAVNRLNETLVAILDSFL
ncbi:MAG TPA: futalosine hydrolase [Saprospiraceae bacterium]|nr:futalosine hydrolase [Saprospiraceae bacterium]HMQ84077.1 futalosine hydrolase [Saprospiraceae bacterium]